VTGVKPSKLEIVLRLIRLGPQFALEGLKVFLPASIFFFKFLEWWYSSSYARARLSSSSKNAGGPPALRAPPTKLQPHPDGLWGKEAEGESPTAGICVVCRNKTVNPTALPSGYVGDYKCLFDYVEKEGRCPVTRIKFTTGDLRKVNG
jgi:peroxin-12